MSKKLIPVILVLLIIGAAVGYAIKADLLTALAEATTIPAPTTSTQTASTTTAPASMGRAFVIPNGATEIPKGGGYWYNGYTSITIPGSVRIIPWNAFGGNEQRPQDSTISSVTIGNGILEIGRAAFIIQQLTSITIPDSVINIGEQAFFSNKLTRAVIGNNVTIIDRGAFAQNQLTSVTIPASVRAIGVYAFRQTNPITKVSFEGDGVRLETNNGEGPFNGNLHEVYSGRGTYVYNNGAWTKQ